MIEKWNNLSLTFAKSRFTLNILDFINALIIECDNSATKKPESCLEVGHVECL